MASNGEGSETSHRVAVSGAGLLALGGGPGLLQSLCGCRAASGGAGLLVLGRAWPLPNWVRGTGASRCGRLGALALH